ncbi:hypothetical protein L1987_70569 [Smallanthus sonchifolius]|uniref:Uncharacterized protein n=1 Tax=Smallanthus sonchifolius TaxID=185202 RepID=A0ACB9AQW0_9ASTR|nr:hypothetical protein L1987_70569 [Smallanthus sonchifolius]
MSQTIFGIFYPYVINVKAKRNTLSLKVLNTHRIVNMDLSEVKFATGTVEGLALTWWNAQEKYYPRDEIQKLEGEFWNLKMEGSEIELYTTRSHELATMCPHMVTPDYKRIELYIGGIVPQIQSMVTSSNPATI